MFLYFGNEDGRDYIHTTVRSLRTDQQCGSPLEQMENTDQLIEHCHYNTLHQRLLHEKSTVSLGSLMLHGVGQFSGSKH